MFGIAPVGLDLIARLARDERRGDDDALDPQLLEPAGDDEAARAGFVADAHRTFGRAAQLGDETLERVQIVGDGAEVAHFAAAPPFGPDGGDGILVDIKSEEEGSSLNRVGS